MAKEYLDKTGLTYLWSKIKALLNGKQDTLVSGTNIKTINNTSLLGSGNISISGGGTVPENLSDLTNDYLSSSLFVVEKVSSGISISVTTSGASGNRAYTKSGYTCLGVVGYDCQGTGVTQCNVYRLYWDGSKVYAYIRTASSTTITVYPYLLWLKTS